MNEQSREYLINEYNFCSEMIKHNDQLWLQMLKFYITVNSALFIAIGTFIKYSYDKISISLPTDFTVGLIFGIIKLKIWLSIPVSIMIGFNFFYLIYLRSKKRKNIEYIRAINRIRKGFRKEMGDNAKECIGLPDRLDIPRYHNLLGTDSVNAILIMLFNTSLVIFLTVLLTIPGDIHLIQNINKHKYAIKALWPCASFFILQYWIYFAYLIRLDNEGDHEE